jgi:predicted nucleotide-binding protein (sugar kinase/HSP70/actin superfamily)
MVLSISNEREEILDSKNTLVKIQKVFKIINYFFIFTVYFRDLNLNVFLRENSKR